MPDLDFQSPEGHALRTAWVTEETGSAPMGQDGCMDLVASARFMASVDHELSDDASDYSGEWLTLDEALDWARARAGRVIVRCLLPPDQRHFSAGDISLAGDDRYAHGGTVIEAWPEEGLELEPRRIPGYEYLDRTDTDDAIRWATRVEGGVDQLPDGLAEAWTTALQAQPGVAIGRTRAEPPTPLWLESDARRRAGEPHWTVSRCGYRLRAEVTVTARTVAAASELAKNVAGAALDVALGNTSIGRDDWNVNAYPADSEQAFKARLR